MTKTELLAAELSARQFLKVCERLRTEDHTSKVVREEYAAKHNQKNYGYVVGSEYFDSPSKHVAAVKRASLDLTCELAKLRRRKK
jgi:hypothetical protein